MKNTFLIIAFTGILLLASCGKEQKKRGLDYDKLKQELVLNSEQAKKFDALTANYKQIMQENKAASSTEGGQLNRVAFFSKMEEIYQKQTVEIASFLDENQLKTYNEFMSKNTRKRPRYNDELLATIKTNLELTEEQSKILEAANNAFEKEFYDEHDIYHGNSELAAEYWRKYDNQRKSAIESTLSEEQIVEFRELVKNEKSPSEK